MKKRKYSVVSLVNGIVKIRKPCGYCEKRHYSEFPVDDLLVKRRMHSLCDICQEQLEEVKKKYPDILK
jgi:hypothetical protein